jgi:DNA-binding protein HU-beta
MIKVDLVEKVMDATDLKKPEAIVAVNSLFEGIKKALIEGDRIELRGFGVFQIKDRKRGIGRNPKTGREVEIPPGKTIRFKPGKGLRDLN